MIGGSCCWLKTMNAREGIKTIRTIVLPGAPAATLKTMNAREGIKTNDWRFLLLRNDVLKTMNAREGIKT